MKPIIDMSKEYGLVLEGGGARGAYQIGAWKALMEAGVKIVAVAGTSVGALNGALICMNDIELAEKIWSELASSDIMDVDDDWMERFFNRETSFKEVVQELKRLITEGGIDVTPLKQLIWDVIDEHRIRRSNIDFYLLTYSKTDRKELDLSIEDIPPGLLPDYLLASAYLWGFKNESLHGKKYMDGGIFNNVPLNSLVDRGHEHIISIRIYGPGREPKVKLSESTVLYEITPRVNLGSILEFRAKRSQQNIKIGYYDAKRLLYGLIGQIYYIEQSREEWYYEEKISTLTELEKAEIAFVLKLPLGYPPQELYLAMLEASAKQLRLPKYAIYKERELEEIVRRRYALCAVKDELPDFVHRFMQLGKEISMNLKGRSFLTLKDYSPEEILYLVNLAEELKAKKKQGIIGSSLAGKNIGLIFEKPSTRTRCAFTVAANDEGGFPTYLAGNEIQLGHKESIEDTARVLGRMFDGLEFRGFRHDYVEALARYSGVPVWNGLTDDYHPTQCLATLLTIKEHLGRLDNVKVVYLGDGRNNVANSLMIGCIKVGIDVVICGPKELWPAEELLETCRKYAKDSGADLEITEDLDGVKGADVLYTDVWTSMGEESKEQERINLLKDYQVNAGLMKRTGKADTIFTHCLPAVKGKEVTGDVFESDASVVFDEAENRLHTIKAVMVATLGEE